MGDELTERIIGAAIEVHRYLGPGLLEYIYQEALCHEFELRSLNYQRHVEVTVDFKGKAIKGERSNLLVENEVLIEFKSISILPEVAIAQLLSCLKSSGKSRGLLLDFNEKRLVDGIKSVSL